MRLKLVGLIVSVLISTDAAWGDGYQNGNGLLSECSAQLGDFRLSKCIGYLEGIADAMTASPINGFRACIPIQVEAGQLKDLVMGSLLRDPAHRHLQASGLVARAFEDAFPCR